MGELFVAMNAAMLSELNDRYDRACKRLLSDKRVLGWILHECLEEYADIDPIEIAENLIEGTPEVGSAPVHADADATYRIMGMSTEDSSIAEGTVFYDIRFSARVPCSDELMGMIVNVEAQGEFYPGYPLLKRAGYYCARMISSQYGRVFAHSHYEKLQKVCSIWVCPNPPTRMRNTVTRYAVAEEYLVGAAKASKSEYDLVEVVLVCPDGDRQEKGDGILRLLGTLLASERSVEEREAIIGEEFGIALTQDFSDGLVEMSNVSVGLQRRWFQQGMQAGIEQGVKQGIEQGLQQGIERERVRSMATIRDLSRALSQQGRLAELDDALSDDETFQRYLDEFGLTLEC